MHNCFLMRKPAPYKFNRAIKCFLKCLKCLLIHNLISARITHVRRYVRTMEEDWTNVRKSRILTESDLMILTYRIRVIHKELRRWVRDPPMNCHPGDGKLFWKAKNAAMWLLQALVTSKVTVSNPSELCGVVLCVTLLGARFCLVISW